MAKWIRSPSWFPSRGLKVFYACSFSCGLFLLAQADTNVVVTSPGIEHVENLIEASLDGDDQKISQLLTNKLDLNASVGPGLTAWEAAKIKGHTNILDLFEKQGAQTNAARPNPDAVLDWYLKRKFGTGSPGLALAVVRDGNVIFKHGWGLANLEYNIPITPASVFHVASVSKQFTAFSIALLAQQGKLSLDDDIRKYLPEMPDYGTTITIRHLLSHTSGLKDQWTLLPISGEWNGDVVRQSEVVKLIERQRETLFPPGERFLYCNSGYTLLSEIVSRVSGKSFGDFTRQEIFAPLGMTNSHFHTNIQEVVTNMAYCYYLSAHDGYRKDILNYETVGATGLYTTAEDLAKWIANFEHPRPGWAAPLALMQQSRQINRGESTGYGMGLFIEQYRGARLIQHGGADASYRSFVLWFPDRHLGVALLSNFASTDSRQIALTAAEVYLGDQLSPVQNSKADEKLPVVQLSPADLDRYVGKYESSWLPYVEEFYRAGDYLAFHENNDSPLVLTPNGHNRFSGENERFVFQELTSGQAEGFTNRWQENFQRIHCAEEKQPEFDAYAGDYWSSELETFLTIRLQDGQLVLELHRYNEIPLRYLARNLFATANKKDTWFKVDFQRDTKDAVTGLRLNTFLFTRRSLH